MFNEDDERINLQLITKKRTILSLPNNNLFHFSRKNFTLKNLKNRRVVKTIEKKNMEQRCNSLVNI